MGQHHLVGVPAFAHPRHRVDPLLERQVDVGAEPVHPDIGPVGDEFLQIADIGGVTGVPDHHPGQVDALGAEDPLLLEAAPGRGVGVGRDGDTGVPVGLGDGAQHPFDAGGDARFVGGALEDRGANGGAGDTFARYRG